jgi:hypothetical protein
LTVGTVFEPVFGALDRRQAILKTGRDGVIRAFGRQRLGWVTPVGRLVARRPIVALIDVQAGQQRLYPAAFGFQQLAGSVVIHSTLPLIGAVSAILPPDPGQPPSRTGRRGALSREVSARRGEYLARQISTWEPVGFFVKVRIRPPDRGQHGRTWFAQGQYLRSK